MDLTYIETVLRDKPVAYWPLMETQGTTAYDWVGGNHGTIQGGVTLGQPTVPGLPGTAMAFDGSTTGYIQLPTPGTALTAPFSVEVWAYPTTNTTINGMFGTRGPTDESFDMKLMGGNLIHGDIGTGSAWLTIAANASYLYPLNAWLYVVYVVTATTYTIYANGVSVGSGTFSGATPLLWDSAHIPEIGNDGSDELEYFTGRLAHVAVYPTALTAAPVQAHYFARPRSSLVT